MKTELAHTLAHCPHLHERSTFSQNKQKQNVVLLCQRTDPFTIESNSQCNVCIQSHHIRIRYACTGTHVSIVIADSHDDDIYMVYGRMSNIPVSFLVFSSPTPYKYSVSHSAIQHRALHVDVQHPFGLTLSIFEPKPRCQLGDTYNKTSIIPSTSYI